MDEVGYLSFSVADYDFIRIHFPKLHSLFEQYVLSRNPKIELEVTDAETDMLDNKVLMTIGDSATPPYGDPTREAIKLEEIWDRA